MFDKNLLSVCLLGVFTFLFFSFKLSAVFQQCGYRIKEFFSAVFCGKKKEILRLSTYSVVFAVILIASTLFLKEYHTTFSLCVFITATILCQVYFATTKAVKKAKFTHRYVRIISVSALFSALFCAFILQLVRAVLSLNFKFYGVISLALIPILVPLFISVGKIINYPYDLFRYKTSKAICKKRLSKNKRLIKIGITGSSGKTSVKNYLAKMLATKYRVLATPLSYNTPLGICLTAKGGVENYDVFIAEMGARYKNDIKELCKIVQPQIGVITSILPQHTKTLGGIQGVKNAKYQLIQGLSGEKTSFFYNDGSHLYDLYKQTKTPKILIGDGGVVSWQNAVQRLNGIDFELVVGKKVYKAFTPLLGFHNLQNICIATSVALLLNVEIGKILAVIQNLTPPKHRAEIIRTEKGVTVIDDGYNANIEGIKSTAAAISKMNGNKIAVTSGIVELGKESKNLNEKVGRILAENFSLVIATGVNSPFIKDGVLQSHGNILVLENMQKIKDYLSIQLKSGDVVAFFNDLPDVYDI